ncbi:hypothetical protein RUM43_005889 [Polyplax serrata]|uniref:CUE domain-containing protein n=1 Tax=Polyplax serrata TaxID=468196 RepID=A0AAN8PK70_POLSC
MANSNSNEDHEVQIQSTTQLDFRQAMQDFKTMFPEMDHDVIEEVLRANQGAVDATIDQLLSMTTDNLNEALRLHLEKVEGNDLIKNPVSNFSGNTECDMAVSSSSKRWHPPLLGPLPPTFLRIDRHNQMSLADCTEDERIALFLQNEEFLSELRVNQDFMNTLNLDVGEKVTGGPDIEIFKERLKNMGKMSRNKFSQLSRMFQRRKKNRSAKGILDQSASGDSMLLGAEPLLSDNLDQASGQKDKFLK